MTAMEESEFVVHALRDFLRPFVGEQEVRLMDIELNCGEPVSAIITGLGIAQHFNIWLPPIFEEKILPLEDQTDLEREVITEQLRSLPAYLEAAS
ncbi:hypothetical protein M2118_000561 [Aurantimicrobium minutum]|uniref:hypothetical protein n=1 Tax=Aurantimicrobium minutum TaxID=708131 RepID=UPI0024730C32|nr:hypothetical protein [Aurantimicrobium minutum]MDH6277598.1 hypothetical protein [Aurantimicrobium minutum]